jgi:hypothetical protein
MHTLQWVLERHWSPSLFNMSIFIHGGVSYAPKHITAPSHQRLNVRRIFLRAMEYVAFVHGDLFHTKDVEFRTWDAGHQMQITCMYDLSASLM